jgi:CheY-like chemotaxis protein
MSTSTVTVQRARVAGADGVAERPAPAPGARSAVAAHLGGAGLGVGQDGAVSSPRVLVADDDGDQRLLAEIAVRRGGFDDVTTAADGAQALRLALQLLPELVVLDVSMPGPDGLEICSALRSDPRTAGMRIVLLSASAEQSAVRAGLAAGADAYVTKPFRVRALGVQVAAMLAV